MQTQHPLLLAIVSVCVLSMASACSRGPGQRTFDIQGQVLGVDLERREILLKHDAIPGFMDAMTMPFRVSDDTALEQRVPGDLVTATLVIADNTAYLTDLRRVGSAEVPGPPLPPASSGFELLRDGDAVPDAIFVDHDGRERRFSSWEGRTVVLTFIFTRCPLPTFCPLMDRQFLALQEALAADPALRDRVALVSISFDPAYDTPDVLRGHAASLGADPSVWTFVTGERDTIDRFGARLGMTIVRNEQDPADIMHNLRTVVVDPEGRLVRTFQGNDWTPGDVLAALAPRADAS